MQNQNNVTIFSLICEKQGVRLWFWAPVIYLNRHFFMKIAVIGAGYVGLVTGVCLAETGHDVSLMDIDKVKIATLKQGKSPIYEPDLAPLLQKNLANGRLRLYDDLKESVEGAAAIFLVLPTPPKVDGSSNLAYLLDATKNLAPHLKRYTVIITKSTVPVGTTVKVANTLAALSTVPLDVVSNPEFLREGMAVQDFMSPQGIIVGTKSKNAEDYMRRIYAPFIAKGCPFLRMDQASAELSKYANNAFLATKISFINEIAKICHVQGADIRQVQKALSLDSRIGKDYLKAGLGYGGSCLPKDLASIQNTSKQSGLNLTLLAAVSSINDQQCLCFLEKLKQHFKEKIKGRTLAVWGLSFKPDTDDIREAPAIKNIKALRALGVELRVYDPVAMDNTRKQLGTDNLFFATDAYEALKGAEALLIMTEWTVFSEAIPSKMQKIMKSPVIFDGRNIYDPEVIKAAGFEYYAIGI